MSFPKGIEPHDRVFTRGEMHSAAERTLESALRALRRPIKQRPIADGRRQYIAYDAHDILAGDHEQGRPGHLT